MYKLLKEYRPKTWLLERDRIKSIIKPWHDANFVFSPLDKNTSTWNITCPNLYLELTCKEFDNTQYYLKCTESSTIKIETSYLNVSKKPHTIPTQNHIDRTKKWSIGRAYLLHKNKDNNRTRLLVPFSNFLSKHWGPIVARSMTVMIKKLNEVWQTFDLFRGDKFIPLLHQNLKYKSKAWKIALETGELTLMKHDVKSQFANLNKDRGVKEAIEMLKSTFNTEHLNLAIRKRKYEKFMH